MAMVVDEQFYLNERHIGQSRAASCFEMLSGLNKYVKVSLEHQNLSAEFLQKNPFQVLHAVLAPVVGGHSSLV